MAMELQKIKKKYKLKVLEMWKMYIAMFLIIFFGIYAGREHIDNTIVALVISAIVSVALGKPITKLFTGKEIGCKEDD